MIAYADPSVQPLNRVLGAMELGRGFQKGGEGVVSKYLCRCRRQKEKRATLLGFCLDIVRSELQVLAWRDKCFDEWVIRMIEGADVSQLDYFLSHYKSSKNKNQFFIGFVINEL